MYDLTISQEYYLCAVNEKGKFSAFDTGGPICLLAGGLLDLIAGESIIIDEKEKVQIAGALKEEYRHLASLYDYIGDNIPKKAADLALDYTFTISDKHIKALMRDVGASLAQKQCAQPTESGLFSKAVSYAPDPQAVDRVVQKIRAELLENGVVSDNVIALVGLLNKSNDIKKYFSQYEKEQLNSRLKELKNTPSSKMTKNMIDTVDSIIVIIAAT